MPGHLSPEERRVMRREVMHLTGYSWEFWCMVGSWLVWLGLLMTSMAFHLHWLLISLPIAAVLIWPMLIVLSIVAMRRNAELVWGLHGLCKRCGYDLRGNDSGRCPECGEESVGRETPGETDRVA
jgi:hypothetical protein